MRRRPSHWACLNLWLGLVSVALGAENKPFQQDAGADGLVSIECEHYDKKVDTTNNTWSLVTTAAAPLYVMVQDSAGKSKIIAHPDPAATTLTTWQAWRIPLNDISAGGVKLAAAKKLVLGVGDRANPKPDGAGKLFIGDIGVGHPAATNP